MEAIAEDSLIELWQHNPCLYNVVSATSALISNRVEKRKALEYIGSKVNLTV